MSAYETRRLQEALNALPAAELARIKEWALAAEDRDPKVRPARLDKLMASAGGAAARYRDVRSFDGETVWFYESSSPFAKTGKPGRMPLARWQKWAARAHIEFRAPLETHILMIGYRLHWEILDAMGLTPPDSQPVGAPGTSAGAGN